MDTQTQDIYLENLKKPLAIKSFSIENDAGVSVNRSSEPELYGDMESFVNQTFSYESLDPELKRVLQVINKHFFKKFFTKFKALYKFFSF